MSPLGEGAVRNCSCDGTPPIDWGIGGVPSCPHPEMSGTWIGDVAGFVCDICGEFFIETITEDGEIDAQPDRKFPGEIPRRP